MKKPIKIIGYNLYTSVGYINKQPNQKPRQLKFNFTQGHDNCKLLEKPFGKGVYQEIIEEQDKIKEAINNINEIIVK